MTAIASDWAQAQKLLTNAQRILILTHVGPDGDAIGSQVGLGHSLRSVGKTVTMVVDEGAPGYLRFLPGSAEVRPTLDGVQADLVIAVDCSDEARVGQAGEAARKLGVPWINLDHHRTNTLFANANIVDADFVATAEGIIYWLDKLGIAITSDTAQCLLCGIVTDTMCFRINTVTAGTFGLAQRLMADGAKLTTIVQNTLNRMPTATIRLWGQVMPTAQIEDHVVWVKITNAARAIAGYPDHDDGRLVSLLLQADDAYISCVFRELDENNVAKVELSLRAKPGFDVSTVAFAIGGGGHLLASGATVPGTLDEVEVRVIPMLKEAAKPGQLMVG